MPEYVVSSGQVSSGFVISSFFNELLIEAGGTAIGTVAYAGAQIEVDGLAVGDVLSGATEDVASGGVAISTMVFGQSATAGFGGLQEVEFGGSARAAVIGPGGEQIVLGNDVDTTIDAGGRQFLSGSSLSATVSDGGMQTIGGAGFAGDAVLDGGAQQVGSTAMASGTVILAGGVQTVSGVTTASVIGAGGQEDVVYGVASGSVVLSGGVMVVIDATAVAAEVQSGGLLVVLPNAHASGTVREAGGAVMSTGVVVLEGTFLVSANPTLIVGGTVDGAVHEGEYVLDGGTASGTVVVSSGAQTVYSGGLELGGTIDGGFEFAGSGATVRGAAVELGGAQTINFGAFASGGLLHYGGTQLVEGSAFNTYIGSEGVQSVFRGDAASTTVVSGGAQIVAGGEATDTVVDAGGSQVGSYGAILSYATLAGGVQILSGGDAYDTRVNAGGREIVSSGVSVDTVIGSGGLETVASFAVAQSTHILAGGTLIVTPGGSATGTIVDAGGTLISGGAYLYSGSTLISVTQILSGVTLSGKLSEVLNYGTAIDTLIESGGEQRVSAGGVTTGSTLAGSGIEIVSSGGLARTTVIENGGGFFVSGGGIAEGVTVSSGGVASQYGVDAVISGITVDAGGLLSFGFGTPLAEQVVVAGGTVDGTYYDEGAYGTIDGAVISGGGLLSGVAVLSGAFVSNGSVIVDGQGIAAAATLAQGGLLTVLDGSVDNLSVSFGGAAILSYGGHLDGATLYSGGYVIELPNASASGIISSGGALLSAGVAVVSDTSVTVAGATLLSGAMIGGGETAYVLAGGTLADVEVDTLVYAYSGGVVSDITIASAGGGIGDLVQEGAVGEGVTILAGGTQSLGADALIRDVFVGSGAAQTVYWGSATSTTIAGGVQLVDGSQAYTLSTIVESGGVQSADAGIASATVLLAGGTQRLSYLGQARGTVISAGGMQVVSASGEAFGTLIASGGVEEVGAGTEDAPNGESIGAVIENGGSAIADAGYLGYYFYPGGAVSNVTLERGGVVDSRGLTFDAANSASFSSATDVLSIVSGGTQVGALQLVGAYGGETFVLTNDGENGTDISVQDVPCYCRGTRILTERGEVAVEDLAIGDGLVTHAGAVRRLRWIGRRAYDGRFAAGNPNVLPVLIAAGALGDGLPWRDLLVSPQHALFVDEVLVPAICLVDGVKIAQVGSVARVEYFHVELASHDIVFAEGAAAETFLDEGCNRAMFHNGATYAALYPQDDDGPVRYCAPRVEGGAFLEAIRDRLGLAGAQAGGKGKLQSCIDEVAHGYVAGWATDGAGPVRIEVRIDGVAQGEICANRFRADLARAGLAAGRCAFAYHFPVACDPSRGFMLELRRASDSSPLAGSPCVVPPAGCLEALDVVARDRARAEARLTAGVVAR